MDSLLGDGACHALDQFKCRKLVDVQDVKIISRDCMRNVKHGGIGMNSDTREQAASSKTGSIKVSEATALVCPTTFRCLELACWFLTGSISV